MFLVVLIVSGVTSVVGQPGDVPTFEGFHKITAVSKWIGDLAARGDASFSVGALARAQNKYLAQISQRVVDDRPSSMDVRGMFSAHHMQAGDAPLEPGDNDLRLEGFTALHRLHCGECVEESTGIASSCYMAQVMRCLSHGFDPPRWCTDPPVPLYRGKGPEGNHQSCWQHREYVEEQVRKLRDSRVIRPATGPVVQAPLGVTITPSKIMAALRLTGIYPGNDHTFVAAKARLAALVPGFEQQFKRRMISDITAPGLNAQMDVRPFSYIDINDFVALVKPNCWMGVVDIVGYYLNFPLATRARPRFGLRWGGLSYVWGRLPFGGAAHPYLASVITAEICAGLRAQGIPVVAMIDDFGMVGDTYDVGWARLQQLQATIRSLGFQISEDKNQFAQRVKFIGFLVDAVRMVISFDKVSTAAFAEIVRQGIESAAAGERWDNEFALHLAGKLNHIADVVQAGRLRLATVWAYVRTGGELSTKGRSRLMIDLGWWEQHLLEWSVEGTTAGQFPIINTAMLLLDQLALLIGVTDFSGPDGVGGHWGRLYDPDPEVFTYAWKEEEGPVKSSLVGELYGLWHLLCLLSDRKPQPVAKLFIWVTDNLGAAFCVNAGNCSDEHDGRLLLQLIFELLLGLGWFIIAIWHPRTSNCLADFYSHLSRYLGVDALVTTVSGARRAVEDAAVAARHRVSVAEPFALPGGEATQGLRVEDYEDQGGRSSKTDMEQVSRVLSADGSGSAAAVQHHRRVSVQICGATAGVNTIGGAGEIATEVDGAAGTSAVVVGSGGHAAADAHAADGVRGHIGRAADDSAEDVRSEQGHFTVGSVSADGVVGGNDCEDRPTRIDARSRGDGRAEGSRHAMAEELPAGAVTPVAHQARTFGGRAVRYRRTRRQRQVRSDEVVTSNVGDAEYGRQSGRVLISSHQSGEDRHNEGVHRGGVARAGQANCSGGGI